jgi:RNAse (barnase) inhibitor barstar
MLKLEYKQLIIKYKYMVKIESKTIKMFTTTEEELKDKLSELYLILSYALL